MQTNIEMDLLTRYVDENDEPLQDETYAVIQRASQIVSKARPYSRGAMLGHRRKKIK